MGPGNAKKYWNEKDSNEAKSPTGPVQIDSDSMAIHTECEGSLMYLIYDMLLCFTIERLQKLKLI